MRITNGEPFFIGSPERIAHVKGPTNGFHSTLSGEVISCSAGPEASRGAQRTVNRRSGTRFLSFESSPSHATPLASLESIEKFADRRLGPFCRGYLAFCLT